MALTTRTMTDEQRKSVALEYLKAFDNRGRPKSWKRFALLLTVRRQFSLACWRLVSARVVYGFILLRDGS